MSKTACALVALIVFIAGVLFGGNLIRDATVNDCQIMGKFRFSDDVYLCKKVSGETV